jgi:hypothetical protein
MEIEQDTSVSGTVLSPRVASIIDHERKAILPRVEILTIV